MYQDHPQFKTLLQCMGPEKTQAVESPAAAMLAMLRNPRMLDTFGEVDVLVGAP